MIYKKSTPYSTKNLKTIDIYTQIFYFNPKLTLTLEFSLFIMYIESLWINENTWFWIILL